jgi:molybdopterin/thiamine biosynthesis adenylyltransferase
LDALARDERITHVSLLDPDTYQAHNVERHLFDMNGIGQSKVDLAVSWFRSRCPNLELVAKAWDLLDENHHGEIEALVNQCDIGVCAADNEAAKYSFDCFMRRSRKPWTLGEVLSGGIGGFVHRFTADGACYGCAASYLQRNVVEGPAPKPRDYSLPNGDIEETRIPASRAAIQTMAGLHALITLDLLFEPRGSPGFTSLLLSLKKVDGVFAEAYRPHRIQIPKLPGCLVCGTAHAAEVDLDVALDQALARLGDA